MFFCENSFSKHLKKSFQLKKIGLIDIFSLHQSHSLDGQTYTRCTKALHPKKEGEREDERYLFLSENYVKSDNNIILVNVSVWKKGMIISGNFP